MPDASTEPPTDAVRADAGTPGSGTAGARRSRAAQVSLGAFLVWTGFVWIGRIRNALADTALSDSERVGPLLLSASFLVPTLVMAVAWVLAIRDRRALDPWASMLLVVLAAWTTVVWVLRAGDIALAGDHEAPFVVVHVTLAVISIGLGVWAALADRQSVASSTRSR
jgi:hypothetical protein